MLAVAWIASASASVLPVRENTAITAAPCACLLYTSMGPDGEVVVADTAWPRPSISGKLEIYCQFKADNANRTGLNPEPIKPYANYFVPNRGYQETFADWDNKVKGAYPLQAYTPHYLRRAHTCYDNMTLSLIHI